MPRFRVLFEVCVSSIGFRDPGSVSWRERVQARREREREKEIHRQWAACHSRMLYGRTNNRFSRAYTREAFFFRRVYTRVYREILL